LISFGITYSVSISNPFGLWRLSANDHISPSSSRMKQDCYQSSKLPDLYVHFNMVLMAFL
ncbi:hypothetical protein KI387_005586, partial [Taxus chinensis]